MEPGRHLTDWDSFGDNGELNYIDYSRPETLFTYANPPKPSSFPKPAEVRLQARKRSASILSSWSTLQKILDRHEETIRKRWMKKTKAQRKAILLNAWPNMPSSHRPDFQAFMRESPQQRLQATKFKDAYMWPYINLEDLLQGKSLLLFLNSRGHHPPSMFAHADQEAAHYGRLVGATRPPFLNEYTMFLDGQTVGTYGKLDAWANNDEAFDLMMSGLGLNPGEGLLILEIQQQVYSFLMECCQIILHDLDKSSLTDDQVPIKPEPPTIFGDPTEWPTLASIAGEAPYRVPSHLDFRRLKAVIAAKRSAAEDHIWALREDPGYYSDVLGDWREHRQETLLDTNGNRHPILTNTKPLLWELVISNVIFDAYGGLLVWGLLYNELLKLEALKDKYSNVISPQKELPREYMKALVTFRYMLDQASRGPILNLKLGIPASPPLRSLFVREPYVPNSTIIRVQVKSGVGSDHLLWLFMKLWDNEQLFLCRLPDLVDELERTIASDRKQKERISGWATRVLSDLGVIARSRHEIDIYQPWAAGIDNAFEEHREEIQEEFAKKFTALAELHQEFEDFSLARFGTPTDDRFQYPSDKRRTQQINETMRKAERNLDLFWKTVDQQYKTRTGKTLHEAFLHVFKEEHLLERTPEWIEPVKDLTKKKVPGDPEFDQILPQLSIAPKEELSDKLLPKAKVKTKGAPQPSDPNTPEIEIAGLHEHPVAQNLDIQSEIKVTRRAFKVFRTIFHSPDQTDHPGEISWQDFLHAMVATGFQPSKLYGSIWQFTPTNLDVERSIQFHEPHPRGKIPFRTARRIGRRLGRVYGWEGRMFVLEE